MRSDPGDFGLIAPGSLQEAVAMLAKEPGVWLPIAGGTDVMVLYGAGTLRSRKLISIWNLPELRGIEESSGEIAIGAGCTYSDLRNHPGIAREFPLLARAAAVTGGIANQNRGTLGGNIANASPAADSLPALLVYDAELTLASVRGERRIAYRGFHAGYKKTTMAADELIRTIHLKKQFTSYMSYWRKAGARQSQAIAKVNIAAIGKLAGETVKDVRVGLGSVAPVPLRLGRIERFLIGKNLKQFSPQDIRRQVEAEISPISDIRSTTAYRNAVAANLVVEFLKLLCSGEQSRTKESLARWNVLGHEEAMQSILPCCGALAWAEAMAARRPFRDEEALLEGSREIWWQLGPEDWREAFRSHPRIGESQSRSASARSSNWSSQEQAHVSDSDNAVKLAIEEGNRQYEERFGQIFIVCAAGRSAREIHEILRRRLLNDDATEFQESAKEQQKITQLRLKKWLEA